MPPFCHFGANLSFDKQTVDGSVMAVSGSYFPLLGVRPLMGRLIAPEDDVQGAGHAVAVLSHGYWQNRLGGRPDVLNQSLRVNSHIFTIVGVTPKGFTGTALGDQPDLFVPLCFKPLMTPGWDGTDSWDDYWLYLLARLKPGVGRRQAEAALNSVYSGLLEEQANATAGHWRAVNPPSDFERFRKSRLTLTEGRQGQSELRDEARTPLWILMASTALVLLIAIATIANLLLARGAQRKKEVAVRVALGAGRFRMLRQGLTEALLLSLGGGGAGVLLAMWTAGVLAAGASRGNPSEDLTGRLEWPALLFAAGVSIAAGLLCGLYPAWESTRASLATAFKEQAGQVSAGLSAARVRKALVCAQITVSVLLLIPTGLFLKSLVNLLHVDVGVKTENLLTFRISPELNGYKPEQSRALFERAEEQLAAIPGVRSVTASMVPLIAGSNWGTNLTVEGYTGGPKADTHSMYNRVGSGCFGRLGIPLVSGREFSERDTLAGAKVAVVNERFVRYFFEGRDPLGRRFARGAGNEVKPDLEIVGVVKDSHYSGIRQVPPRVFYTPWRQSENIGAISFYVRTALTEEQMVPQIRRVMRSLDPNLPLEDLRTLEEQIRRNIRSDRMVLQLSAAFSVLATLLAMFGLYGVVAYSVTRRTREIGIRLALGAPRASIGAMVMRELLLILVIGLVTGVPAALGLARLAESRLFGVKSFDIAVVAGAVLSLAAAALIAGYLPARRATRLDPLVALRLE